MEKKTKKHTLLYDEYNICTCRLNLIKFFDAVCK